jgi:hypothetical protein
MLCVAPGFGALFSWISKQAFMELKHFGRAPERFGGVFDPGLHRGRLRRQPGGLRIGLSRARGHLQLRVGGF